MNHASLFSGIGGFDLAAEWVGWNNVFHCEIDEFCLKILKYHFPNAITYTDIKKTNFTKHRGEIDILTGGFPCQPFSVAGKRKGTDDRYLWPEMLRAISEIRPGWVIGENVGGIVSMVQPGCEVEVESQAAFFEKEKKETILEQQYVIETICSDIESIGYSVQPVVIPACAIGAPHRRDRVWFIANRTDTGVEAMQCRRKDRISTVGAITNTESQQSERYRPEQSTNGSTEQREFGRSNSENNSEYAMRGWENFPTQSPVCRRNDGLPFNVDDLAISFAQWRKESVKAYGNAIVPQVAYEIFKAIQETYNQ